MHRVKIGQALHEEFTRAAAQFSRASEVDVGQNKARQNEERTGGESAEIGQFDQRQRHVLRVLMYRVKDHQINGECEAQHVEANELVHHQVHARWVAISIGIRLG
ncbi:hypothetical protein QF025_004928 [Paraburkholderia graminis]|uniref:Uncharacterized protein n=1 Tax=Paraburkholderia graminis TaxID=60548 RepID=A0ABD5CMI2_9BURK|nr:hypothetical protein [Paraburkholderia graminis]